MKTECFHIFCLMFLKLTWVTTPNMALDGVPRKRGAAKTAEPFFHTDNPTAWNDSSGLGRIHDHEEDHLHHGKKLSILARVKDSAKKWRHFIARKKHGRDANHTPSWGVALEDYEVDDDTEPHGNPLHQPQHAGKSSKDNERHNPVSNPIMFHDNHNTSNITNLHPGNLDPISPRRQTNIGRPLVKSHSNREAGTSSIPKLTVDETRQVKSFRNLDREKVPSPSPSEIISEALIMKKSDDKQKDKLLFSEMTVEPVLHGTKVSGDKVGHSSDSKTADDNKERDSSPHSLRLADQETEKPAHNPKKTPLTEGGQTNEAISEEMSEATSKIQGLSISSPKSTGEARKWDKGVSMTEYLKCKLEPGEDERALSQVISEVISPRRSPTEKGVVEKMKTAVTLLLQSEEPSTSSSLKTSDSSLNIPLSINAHEVEEENQGRVLQAN
ncbi:uncharacterized protein LOC141622915 isoform X2 [Silene latifolia]|uniref:uncharacterized protein LOC141622915 isoform X2 n=1 Tax=Silene latifolia TaxID=37657 RepID=UPI003D7726A9